MKQQCSLEDRFLVVCSLKHHDFRRSFQTPGLIRVVLIYYDSWKFHAPLSEKNVACGEKRCVFVPKMVQGETWIILPRLEVVGRRLDRRQDFLHLLSHCPYAYEARDELYLRHNRISYIYLLNGASVLLFLFSNNKYILYPCTCWFQEITEFLFSQQVTAFNETWSENNGMRRDHRNHNNTYTPISKRHKAHNGTRLGSWLVTRTEICAWKNIVGKMIRLDRARNIVVSVETKRFALEILLSRNDYNDDCKIPLKKKFSVFTLNLNKW